MRFVALALVVAGCAEPALGAAVAYIRPSDPTASGPHFDATETVETPE